MLSLLVADEMGAFANVAVDPDDPLETLSIIIEAELGIPSHEQHLLLNSTTPMTDPSRKISSYGVADNATILVLRRRPPTQPARRPQSAAATGVRNRSPAPAPQSPCPNPAAPMSPEDAIRAFVNATVPPPAPVAPAAGPVLSAAEQLAAQQIGSLFALGGSLAGIGAPAPQALARLAPALASGGGGAGAGPGGQADGPELPADFDPLDPEIQRRLAEHIEKTNIEENMQNAYEHAPESFVPVTMLYVDCEVNNVPMKAFVDSGAQSTIMSAKCAEKCNLLRLLDRRMKGIAKGVGSAPILGRVHMAPMKIAGVFVSISVTVLDQDDMDFLLGLDMLRKHQMCIDLKANVLRISEGVETPFLAEKDLPLKYTTAGGAHDDIDLALDENPPNKVSKVDAKFVRILPFSDTNSDPMQEDR